MNAIHFRGRIIKGIVSCIAVLLLINIWATYENSKEIEYNKNVQQEIAALKLNLVETLRAIHLLDLGIRGYSISPNKQLLFPFDSALSRKDRLLDALKTTLEKHKYDAASFNTFKLEVNLYYSYALQMKYFLDRGEHNHFKKLFEEDRGIRLVSIYRNFTASVYQFEDKLQAKAESDYQLALKLNYWLQFLLFLLTVPTLFYLAYYANSTFSIAEKLHQAEAEKAAILESQNSKLEEEVYKRTQELLALNEEVTAQNEEIVSQNEQLVFQQEEIVKQHDQLKVQHAELIEAKELITVQSSLIQQHNSALITEVESQTEYLMRANAELKERNNRLEQFTYVISHNLRGPLSRIQGLASILDLADNESEMRDITGKMSLSTRDLDRVVKDLASITEIRNINVKSFSSVNITEKVNHIIQMLEVEIREAKALINVQLAVTSFQTLSTYIESILYNLIGNAIKYRKPEGQTIIFVESKQEENHVIISVTDNGMGIDLDKYGDSLFLPYKRFHYHVDGRGLGLYMAKSQVEALGGQLMMTSKPNEGTRVSILFPL